MNLTDEKSNVVTDDFLSAIDANLVGMCFLGGDVWILTFMVDGQVKNYEAFGESINSFSSVLNVIRRSNDINIPGVVYISCNKVEKFVADFSKDFKYKYELMCASILNS